MLGPYLGKLRNLIVVYICMPGQVAAIYLYMCVIEVQISDGFLVQFSSRETCTSVYKCLEV